MGKRQRGAAGFIAVTGAACALYALSAGLRSVYGILLGAIAQHTGIAYASVSFVIAVGQLVFGVAQPVFGVVALKKSNAFVLLCGCVLMAAGLAMIPLCAAAWALMLFFGILLPAGTGAVSFGILMSAITPRLGERRAATAAGFVNASSGLGSIVLSPLLQTLFSTVGFSPTMLALGLFSAALVPVTLWTGRPDSANSAQAANGPARESLLRLLKRALRSKSYRYLMIGFFTCGFHMAIIETHLYSQFLSYGAADTLAALAFSAYGVATIVGALLSGFCCGKWGMQYVLGVLYGSRALMILAFLLLPKEVPVLFGAAVFLGLTGSATVVPTSGLVGKLFGAQSLGTLFGLVFLCHQLGSFCSAWLGGVSVGATGGYALIWSVGAALCVLASAVSLRIGERRPVKQAG